MSSPAVKRKRQPRSEGLTAQGNILFIKPLPDGWPKAKECSHRPGLYAAKGINPDTGKRKPYYANCAYDASLKAAQSLGLVSESGQGLPEALTVHYFYCESYWPSLQARSYNWREQVRWAYDHYIGPKWGGAEISAIKKKEVQLWFNSLIGTMENSSLHKVKIVFSGMINAAIDEYEDDENCPITRNPVSRIKLPAIEEPDKAALTPSQLKRLIMFAQDREVAPILLGSIGMPKGEACAVQFDKIRGGILNVDQQVTYEKGKGIFIKPILKTPQRKRKIPLPEALKKALYAAKGVSDIFVCSDSLGGFLTHKNFDRELATACKRAGLPNITPHELRHTFISILENDLEIPTAIVARLAGKKKKGVNRDYSHSTLTQMKRAMERYWELIENADPEECLQECRTEDVLQNA